MADEKPDRGSSDPVSDLLAAWSGQDSDARDRLVPVVYHELRKLAHHYFQGERSNHTLQTTALVHEVYLRLSDLDRMQWRSRTHFFAMAATLMRRILIDHARERGRDKRGGGVAITWIGHHDVAGPEPGVDLIELDAALTSLARLDERQSRIIELRFFVGLTIEETANALDLSPATVGREWLSARAWLHHYLVGPRELSSDAQRRSRDSP